MGSKPVGISASRASAILGLNSYQSSFEVWQRIMEERKHGFNKERGYILPPEPDNAAIRWGQAFEGAIISLAEGVRGMEIGEREALNIYDQSIYFKTPEVGQTTVINDPRWLEITCHIDGRYPDGKLHEGKTTSYFAWKDKWGAPGSEDVPMEYYIQVQHQMICTGADEAVVSVLVFPKRVEEFEELGWVVVHHDSGKYGIYRDLSIIDDPLSLGEYHGELEIGAWASELEKMGYFHQYPVKANPKLQKKLIDLYAIWWQNHVIKEIPPTDCITYEDIRRLCPSPIGTVVCGEEVAKDFARYKKAGRIGGKLKKKQEELKVDLLLKLKDEQAFEDEYSKKKFIFVDETGAKLGQFDGKTFRVN